VTNREQPDPEPLETWKDRVTLRHIALTLVAIGCVAWAAWFVAFGKKPGTPLSLGELLLNIGGGVCMTFCIGAAILYSCVFVVHNWKKPISKWSWL
jgi:hypothetical protein